MEEVCRTAGISAQTCYRWRKLRRTHAVGEGVLKQLEEENMRLQRLVADLALDKEMFQDVIPRKS